MVTNVDDDECWKIMMMNTMNEDEQMNDDEWMMMIVE